MNLLETIYESIKDPTPTPLHAGEVMILWTYAVAIDEGRALCLFMLNHTEDVDLRRFMEQYVKDVEEPQRLRIHKYLMDEGISVPPVTSDKGKTNPNCVPQGARLTDMEVANIFLAKLVAALGVIGQGLVTSIRDDVGRMLYEFQAQLLRQGYVLKHTMMKRGWLKMPPGYMVPRATDAVH